MLKMLVWGPHFEDHYLRPSPLHIHLRLFSWSLIWLFSQFSCPLTPLDKNSDYIGESRSGEKEINLKDILKERSVVFGDWVNVRTKLQKAKEAFSKYCHQIFTLLKTLLLSYFPVQNLQWDKSKMKFIWIKYNRQSTPNQCGFSCFV